MNNKEKLEEMHEAVVRLASMLLWAKVRAKTGRGDLLGKVDEAIDQWNVVINLVPRKLKSVKLDLLKEKR